MKPFVGAGWLQEHRSGVRLADVRWYLDGRSGREAYERGHLPEAVFVDLERWLAAPGSARAGRHPLPDPAHFAEGMAQLGIDDESVVVAYDDAGGVIAARLVWMLRVTGHDAAVLDGGMAAWTGALEQDEPAISPGRFTARPWPEQRLADVAELRRAPVIDAREATRYLGESEPVDPRAGHVPGALSVPCRESLLADGRLRDEHALRARFLAAGIADATPVVSMCGSGVTACHNLLVMEQVGLGVGRLYPGSWSQYSADPALPVAVGPDPGVI